MATYIVSSGVTSTSLTLSDGDTASVYGTAVSTTVGYLGNEFVYSGGTAISTTLDPGGYEFVSSGGTAVSTTVNTGGVLSAVDDATTSFTVVMGGTEDVYAGATAISTTVNSVGTQNVSGTAVDATISSGGTQLVISSGPDLGTAIGTTVDNGGIEYVTGEAAYHLGPFYYPGGGASASDTTVNSGGVEVVSPDAQVTSTTVNSGGIEVVYPDADVNVTRLNDGGSIDAVDLVYTSGGSATVTSGNELVVSVGGQTYSQSLVGDYADVFFNIAEAYGYYPGVLITAETAVGGESAPCYRRGTLILTDHGEVEVENLRVGDGVLTVVSETVAPIVWIGHRDVDCVGHPQPRQVWPVRVAAGALGSAHPHSDLFLSPNHAVFVGDVLIPVRCLVNGSTITQVPVERVTYYHIELPQHDVVLAEGLPAESFLDMRDGTNYANRPGPVRLYPDFSARVWEAFGCARLVVTGPELEAARALVRRYAATRIAA
jgi:autotransporter passenger strand-loop-strand repeat protein